jgi:tetratricopeptide (TPR) repeat protein
MNKALTKTILLCVLVAGFLAPADPGGKNAIYYNREGWQYLRKGDHFRAVLNFKNALKQNPRYADALIGLGQAYNHVEAYEEAARLFADALKLEAGSDRALTGMGFSLTGLGKTKQALDHFNRAVEASGENLDAHYGIANLYRVMGKNLWAERKALSILNIHRYHTGALLLMSDIKSGIGRYDEARAYCQRAIEGESDNPEGHIAHASVLLREYGRDRRSGSLREAVDSLQRALSIQPESFKANRLLGSVFLAQERFADAAACYQKALALHPSSGVLYNLAVTYDRTGNQEMALEMFLKAYKKSPSDSVLRARVEDFLVFRDYEIGNPARVLFAGDRRQTAIDRERKNLPDEAIMYFRRALVLNPMDRDTRENLMRYYDVLGYRRFHLDHLKDMVRLYPDAKYQDRLTVEIIKRRDTLYHREGYSSEAPPRDVPVVMVFDFDADPLSTLMWAGTWPIRSLSLWAIRQDEAPGGAGPRTGC